VAIGFADERHNTWDSQRLGQPSRTSDRHSQRHGDNHIKRRDGQPAERRSDTDRQQYGQLIVFDGDTKRASIQHTNRHYIICVCSSEADNHYYGQLGDSVPIVGDDPDRRELADARFDAWINAWNTRCFGQRNKSGCRDLPGKHNDYTGR
jgi:hypothetical protein